MYLAICEALILVDNVSLICVLADGRQPEVPARGPEIFVHAEESSVDEGEFGLVDVAGGTQDGVGWEG
jgi:hypothetical protein